MRGKRHHQLTADGDEPEPETGRDEDHRRSAARAKTASTWRLGRYLLLETWLAMLFVEFGWLQPPAK